MRTDTPQTIYRKDYTPPSYLVETVELGFDLDPAQVVTPPKGLEIGYVPIATRQELLIAPTK